MPRRFPNRPLSQLSADSGLVRGGSNLMRLVLGERLIISRALCHFETMPALQIDRNIRAFEVAKLGAKARTPIARPDFYLSWGADQLGVWSWPKALTEELKDFEGEVVPETVLHPPLDEGARLVAALDGFEGQVWRGRQLVASRWWRNPPHADAWSGFLRAARVSEGAEGPPPVVALALLGRPATAQPYSAMLDRIRSINASDIAALALALLAAPMLFLLGQWAQLSMAQASVRTELAQLSQETAEISTARQNAQRASLELNAYAQTLNTRHPAALLASISEELSRFSIRLDAFEQTEDELTLTLHVDAEFAPEALVRAMESNPLMNSASLEPGRIPGEWVLRAQLETE